MPGAPAGSVDTPATPAPAPAGEESGQPAPTQPVPADEARDPDPQEAGWTSGIIDVRRQVAGAALLRDVRTARHPEFDRIVLDFGDSGVPGYHLEYIDRPVRQCGSGNVVPLAGDGWLQIRVEPANAHTEEGQPTIRDRARSPEHPNVWELKLVCDFEAQVEWVAGVRTPAPFRAFVLHSPDRLVVDVKAR